MTRIEQLERKIDHDGNHGHGPSTVDIDELVGLLRAEQRALSDAYVRLRAKIPGAFDTPHAPTAEQVWDVTEKALDRLVQNQKRDG